MKKNLLLLALLVMTLNACQSQAPTTAPVSWATRATLLAQGALEPAQFSELSFSQPGRVAEVLVQEGETVTAGQIVARLEGQPARQSDLERARQEVLAAQQALEALSPELAQAQAAATAADAELALAEAQKQADLAQTGADPLLAAQAQARLTLAQVQLALADEKQAELESGKDPALEAARQQLATAQAAEASAQAALEALELKTPLAGKIAELTLKVGQFLLAGQPTMTVADFSSWVVKTEDVTELAVNRVATGQKVTLGLDALPDQLMTGTVTAIAQRFVEKRGEMTYTITIKIENPAEGVRWGMTGQVNFNQP